jgi:hypothetical protein
MNWTSEYPTKAGFYWIRNYLIQGMSETIERSERTIAYLIQVRGGLSFWLFQWPDVLSRERIVKAEWQGPIEPDTGRRYELFSETVCAECLERSNKFISWPIGEVDGKPRFGFICRECWIKRLTPEQRKVYMV